MRLYCMCLNLLVKFLCAAAALGGARARKETVDPADDQVPLRPLEGRRFRSCIPSRTQIEILITATGALSPSHSIICVLLIICVYHFVFTCAETQPFCGRAQQTVHEPRVQRQFQRTHPLSPRGTLPRHRKSHAVRYRLQFLLWEI
jgi:hypothetical protein